MKKVILIIPNPRERLFITNILALAGVQVVGEATSIDEVRERLYNTVSTVADADHTQYMVLAIDLPNPK